MGARTRYIQRSVSGESCAWKYTQGGTIDETSKSKTLARLRENNKTHMNNQLELPKSEKVEVAILVKKAEETKVVTFSDVMDMADILLDIKTIGQKITARKETMTRPMNDALKAARSFFKPFETDAEKAEKLVKDKILAWHGAHWNEQTTTDNTINGLRGKVTVVERVGVEIEDETKIPRELCSPDVGRIKLALEAGLKVKGARLVLNYSITAGKN